MARHSLPTEPTPEPDADAPELIVEIYRQRTALVEAGSSPSRVILNGSHYRIIQEYHNRLGILEGDKSDYLGRYRIFDLEICVEEVSEPEVRA